MAILFSEKTKQNKLLAPSWLSVMVGIPKEAAENTISCQELSAYSIIQAPVLSSKAILSNTASFQNSFEEVEYKKSVTLNLWMKVVTYLLRH